MLQDTGKYCISVLVIRPVASLQNRASLVSVTEYRHKTDMYQRSYIACTNRIEKTSKTNGYQGSDQNLVPLKHMKWRRRKIHWWRKGNVSKSHYLAGKAVPNFTSKHWWNQYQFRASHMVMMISLKLKTESTCKVLIFPNMNSDPKLV